MLHKKTISSNYNQNTHKKTDKYRQKTTKIGLAYVQFYETKLHRVERGVEYTNNHREVAISTDF